MQLKANHNLLLPDGKTEVKAGQVFDFDGDISTFRSVVEPVNNPVVEEKELSMDQWTNARLRKMIKAERKTLKTNQKENKR